MSANSVLRRFLHLRVLPYNLLVAIGVAGLVGLGARWAMKTSTHADPFVALTVRDFDVSDDAVERIRKGWNAESPVKAMEVNPHVGYGRYRDSLLDELEGRAGIYPDRDKDPSFWYRWMWEQPAPDAFAIARFRADLYDAIGKPQLADYFRNDPRHTIRADEIRWGGVDRDGIRPIREPRMIPAGQAVYLADTDKIFGVSLSGEARAYPRRILGHHELVVDTIGGEEITGVYCPLCESMVLYHNRTAGGREFHFGTSGFLYRSNKLMYDRETLSLWLTLTGEPVVGPLVGTGVELRQSPVVTTTWGEWRSANPQTTVLSLEGLPEVAPGKRPNYGEGVAYWMYYRTDRTMFPIAVTDDRLKNKDEVFAPRPEGEYTPVAIAVDFLKDNPVYHLTLGQHQLVIITTPGGANRAYAVGGRRFQSGQKPDVVIDADGATWQVRERGLVAGDQHLPRVPGHRAFWFGWYGTHPDTTLIK
jgi:hypothetical protein